MRTNWISIASIALSALTLALVVSLVLRPAAGASPDTALALNGLGLEVDAMRTEIRELRSVVGSATVPNVAPDLDAIRSRLDSLDTLAGGIDTNLNALASRVDAICKMVDSSPFVPSGSGC
jgi:hypothetical protein